MGLGILEDKVMSHVPGTTKYFNDPERPQYSQDGTTGLKCDTSGPVPIILVPQPSDDPNDPLNWPLWRRDLITFILSLTAIFATALGPILAANTITCARWFRVDFTSIAMLTGYFLLGVGVAGFFFVPTSRVWGKRHLFILGTLILIGTSAWGGSVYKNYNSMLASRIIQGVGCAPFESLVNAAVGDLYFAHQRGIRMAFTNLAVFGGAFFTPVLVGKITHTLGWWWSFYFVAIFCAACLPAVFFFCPETAYRRDSSLNLDLLDTDSPTASSRQAAPPAATRPSDSGETAGETEGDQSTKKEVEGAQPTKESPAAAPANNQTSTDDLPPPYVTEKVTFVQSLALFNGRKSDEHFLKLLLRPLPLILFHPAFLWASLIQGAMIGWTVFIGVILAQFFLGYPLWWDEVETGYSYTSAFLGAVVGFIIAGGLADWSARWMTRRNNGIYEPEFRLLLVIPQMIIGCMGIFGWGISADILHNNKIDANVPLFFFGCEVAGMVIGAVGSSLYIVDAYRDLAIEGFTCMLIFKNFFSFALTLEAFDWLTANSNHAEPVFNVLGAVQVVICVSTIPLYIYGKRIRSYYHRHDLLAFFHLR